MASTDHPVGGRGPGGGHLLHAGNTTPAPASPLVSPQLGQSQVTPKRLVFDDPSGVDAPILFNINFRSCTDVGSG